jgi:hypothetical protein
MPLPTIADREETQRHHRDGDKDENPNEAKPNQVHFAQFGPRLRSILKPSMCFCIWVLLPCSVAGPFVRAERFSSKMTNVDWAYSGPG